MNDSGRLLRVDPILIELLGGVGVRNGPVAAEKELMVAVLTDAIECFWKYALTREGVGPRLFREAQSWLFTDDEVQPFSFVNICEALRLDPSYIRRGIREWKTLRLMEGKTNRPEPVGFAGQNIKRKLKSGSDWALSSVAGIGAKARRTPKMRRRFPA